MAVQGHFQQLQAAVNFFSARRYCACSAPNLDAKALASGPFAMTESWHANPGALIPLASLPGILVRSEQGRLGR